MYSIRSNVNSGKKTKTFERYSNFDRLGTSFKEIKVHYMQSVNCFKAMKLLDERADISSIYLSRFEVVKHVSSFEDGLSNVSGLCLKTSVSLQHPDESSFVYVLEDV